MITGRRSIDKRRAQGERNLVEWARQVLPDRGRLFKFMDPRLEGRYSVRAAQKAAELALACVSESLERRPIMSDVVETLKPLLALVDVAAPPL
eukprot:jgi/Mesen1/48/ME1099561C05703